MSGTLQGTCRNVSSTVQNFWYLIYHINKYHTHAEMLFTHLQATLASEKDQKSSQIVPHVPLYMTSTRPMCSPYVPLTNRISSISVPFPSGLGNWPAEERKLIQVSMMLKIIVFFFLPCSQSTPNFIVTCFSGVQRTLSHFARGAFLYRRGIGVT